MEALGLEPRTLCLQRIWSTFDVCPRPIYLSLTIYQKRQNSDFINFLIIKRVVKTYNLIIFLLWFLYFLLNLIFFITFRKWKRTWITIRCYSFLKRYPFFLRAQIKNAIKKRTQITLRFYVSKKESQILFIFQANDIFNIPTSWIFV